MYECMSSYRCVQRVGRAEGQTPPPSVRSSGSSRLPLIHHAPLCSCVAELARSRIAKARGNHACQLVCRVSDAQGLCPMHNCAESLRQAAQRRSGRQAGRQCRSEEHTSELQSQSNLVCRLLLEKKKKNSYPNHTSHKNRSTTQNY